jgi:hypothetical protein
MPACPNRSASQSGSEKNLLRLAAEWNLDGRVAVAFRPRGGGQPGAGFFEGYAGTLENSSLETRPRTNRSKQHMFRID